MEKYEYRYIQCCELEKYTGWEIVQVIPGKDYDMCIVKRRIPRIY